MTYSPEHKVATVLRNLVVGEPGYHKGRGTRRDEIIEGTAGLSQAQLVEYALSLAGCPSVILLESLDCASNAR